MFAGFHDKGLQRLGYTLGYFGRGSIRSRPGGLSRGPWCRWPRRSRRAGGASWRALAATPGHLPGAPGAAIRLHPSIALTRGSERLPTSGRLGDIAGIPCARHNAEPAFTSRGGAGRVPPPYKGLAGQKILDGALRIGCDGIGLVEGDAVLPVRQHQVDGAIRLISLATATPSAGAQSAERRS